MDYSQIVTSQKITDTKMQSESTVSGTVLYILHGTACTCTQLQEQHALNILSREDQCSC